MITNEMIERALNNIDQRFVQEMLSVKRIHGQTIKRIVQVAVPVAATAAVVALCFGYGRMRMASGAAALK